MFKTILQALGFTKEIIHARSELKRVKIEAQAQTIMAAAAQEGAWEAMAGQNAANSWLDEYWTVILSIPLILAFFPNLQPFVSEGFVALEEVPEWYRWAVLAAISFAFARKKLPDLKSWTRKPKS